MTWNMSLDERIRTLISDAKEGDTDGSLRTEVNQIRDDFGSDLHNINALLTTMQRRIETLESEVKTLSGNG